MMLSTTQLLIVGGVAGAFGVAQISDAIIQRKALALDMAVRQRIYEREARAMIWWRLLDALAIVLLILGVLKIIGRVVLYPSDYGYPMVAAGITLYCLSATVRAWMCHHAYAREAHGSPASSSARFAALLTTLSEVLLASVVCWYVFFYLPSPKGSSSTPAVSAPAGNPGPAATKTPAVKQPPWVSEAEAIRLLGKDADYLEVLVRRTSVRVNVKNDTREYLRDDIEKEKIAGLPTDEEVADELKKVKSDREAAEGSDKDEKKKPLEE